MLTILQAESPGDIALARQLMTEYATALEFNLCFQNFEAEMAGLPGKYAPPAGRLLLAFWDGRPAGVIALRPLAEEDQVCEMKRLYVRPEFRGQAIGRVLVERLIDDARQIGYAGMRLDTIRGRMDHAIGLYRELGFREIPPYCVNPMEGVLYMELSLVQRGGAGAARGTTARGDKTRKLKKALIFHQSSVPIRDKVAASGGHVGPRGRFAHNSQHVLHRSLTKIVLAQTSCSDYYSRTPR